MMGGGKNKETFDIKNLPKVAGQDQMEEEQLN